MLQLASSTRDLNRRTKKEEEELENRTARMRTRPPAMILFHFFVDEKLQIEENDETNSLRGHSYIH